MRTFAGKISHREAHETLWDARKCTLRTERICSMRSFQSCLTKTGCMGSITWEVIVRKTKRDEWCRESSLFYCGFRLGGHVYRGDWAREVRDGENTLNKKIHIAAVNMPWPTIPANNFEAWESVTVANETLKPIYRKRIGLSACSKILEEHPCSWELSHHASEFLRWTGEEKCDAIHPKNRLTTLGWSGRHRMTSSRPIGQVLPYVST